MYVAKRLFLHSSLWAVLLFIGLNACKKSPEPPSNSGDFVEYVSAYTSGLISREADIRIVLTMPAERFPGVGQPAGAKFVTLNPEVEGTLTWADQNSLVFTPKTDFPAGQTYSVSLHLNEIFAGVPEDLKTFHFNVQVLHQSFLPQSVTLRTYSNTDLTLNSLQGELLSNDVASLSELQNLLTATQNGKKLIVKWRQNEHRKQHYFVIDSVARTEKAGSVQLAWSDAEGLETLPSTFEIPALGDFKVVGISVIQSPEQKVIINFSDPLQAEQNLAGLVTIENAENLAFVIDNTELHILLNSYVSNNRRLTVYPGIKNVAGFAFADTYENLLTFDDVKPAVELIGNGNILPNSGNLVLPFKAVNLSAVDAYVLKIYADNVPQFLQTNQLEGDYDLTRVGRPIAYKRINLAGSASNLKQWNNFSIDLASMVKPEPGAVYRIEIKFKQAYSLYQCAGEEGAQTALTTVEEEELNTTEFDGPDSYYWDEYYNEDYYWEDYDYSQRENPCNTAYYSSDRSVARNILATNLALTVKGGDKGDFTTIVTNIISSKPVAGVKISFLNYQQQSIGEGSTNSEGAVKITLTGKPFLVIATSNNQSAYLRVDDGSSLSLSNFDISGSQVQKGLKGFIYAERGVWRPGDTVHTNFMLEDAEKSLPLKHPVIFEVRNPEGKLVERQVKTMHVSGIYSFPFATATNAITGFYTAQVRIGGVSFQKSLRVETIKPNRLKLKLDFAESVLKGPQTAVKLHANWLTGATAGNLKADISMQIRMQPKPFAKFENYTFTDETRSFYTSEAKVFEGALNAKGDAQPSLAMGTYNQAPGMLQAIFVTRVFEPGGDMSIDRQEVDFAPYNFFAGILPPQANNAPWLQTDNPITVGVASVNEKGQPQNRKLTATVYAIDWSWWWSSGQNGLANYTNSSYARSIGTYNVQTKDGKGNFNFTVNYPNYGNYLIRVCDEDGHCASQVVYVDWPTSRDRGGRANPGAPTMLAFTADKENYNTGDVAHLTIPTSNSGRLLVSVENGSEVLKTFWVDAEEGQTEVDLKITEEMTPNVFAFVSYIQPHSKTANDLPIRLYGVIPLQVNDAKTKLQPVLKTAAEWQPEGKAEIFVGEANGKAMTYTLAIVDEGLLDITRFKTPDPWNYFYAKEALGIRTWDYFDNIMGAFGGVIEKNFAIGGDQELDPSGKKRLNRFTPVVRVLGPFTLAAGTTAKHNYKMPNYIGSVRVMVVARHQEAYGSTEKAVPVRKPLMVLATLPRVVGPGEKLRVPVQVFAMKNNIKKVVVKLKTNSFFSAKTTAKELNFTEVGDKMAYFELDVLEKTGKGVVDVTVTSGAETATYQIAIDVRNPNSVELRSQTALLKPGESKQFAQVAFGMNGTNKMSIQASGIPNVNLANALAYLTQYPHGCIEQTVSTAFPQLFLANLSALTAAQTKLTKENVQYALNKLQANQLGSGAFALWPAATQINPWATTYAGHFMLEAEKRGYTLPNGLKKRWLTYEKSAAASWQASPDKAWLEMEQAYRLYVLALAGEADLGAMNRLRNTKLTKNSAWRLAAAYILAGQKSIASGLMQKEYANSAENYYDPTFGNEMRASAMRLENYMLLGDEAKAFEQAITLAKHLNNDEMYTTQATAFAVMNMAKFIDSKKASPLKFSWQAEKENKQIDQSGQMYMHELATFGKQITVTNNGKTDLYITIAQQGQPLPGKEQTHKEGVLATVVYKTLDGKTLNPAILPQGTDFKAVVTITGTADKYKLHDMALTQIFPSGWEIINTRLLELDDVSASSAAHYQDFRDDRVYTYFDFSNAGSRVYEVRLNATYVGKYYLPAPKVEAMYYPSVRYNGQGQWVEVVLQK